MDFVSKKVLRVLQIPEITQELINNEKIGMSIVKAREELS